jgi:hypothetical protein
MISQIQLDFLLQHGYEKSHLVTSDGTFWIYAQSQTHSIVVKKDKFELFLNGNPFENKDMVHLATINVELPLEDFIVLMNAFHFIEI